jgi:hypothetical protein
VIIDPLPGPDERRPGPYFSIINLFYSIGADSWTFLKKAFKIYLKESDKKGETQTWVFSMRVDAPHLRLVVNRDEPTQRSTSSRKKNDSWSGTEVHLVFQENQASSQNAIRSVSEAQSLLQTVLGQDLGAAHQDLDSGRIWHVLRD